MNERQSRKLTRTREDGETAARKRLIGLVAVFLAGVCALVLFQHLEKQGQAAHKEVMLAASRLMQDGMAAIRACREAGGIPLSASDDVNATGLIGMHFSALTTTVGSLEAKRTTTNPNMAGLVAKLLLDAGAREGDAVAIGASGSFPALALATLAAAKALHLRPVLIYSLGASQWGANELDFTWIEMERCLVERGILSHQAAAFSLGGDSDRATELEAATAASLRARVEATGVWIVDSPNLVENVHERMEVYREQAHGARIAAFVNIGGSWANLGTDPAVLALRAGLVRIGAVPEPPRRGVLFEMAREGIPVIHLLNIRDLVIRYGLPWDPIPLPAIGEGDLYQAGCQDVPWRLPVAAGYLAFAAAAGLFWGARLWKKRREQV